MIDGVSTTEKARPKGKAALTTAQRKAIWAAVVKASNSLDWKAIAEETGIDTTKLKRHLREVLSKDVERMLSAS